MATLLTEIKEHSGELATGAVIGWGLERFTNEMLTKPFNVDPLVLVSSVTAISIASFAFYHLAKNKEFNTSIFDGISFGMAVSGLLDFNAVGVVGSIAIYKVAGYLNQLRNHSTKK